MFSYETDVFCGVGCWVCGDGVTGGEFGCHGVSIVGVVFAGQMGSAEKGGRGESTLEMEGTA